jgi:predicted ferric reductase
MNTSSQPAHSLKLAWGESRAAGVILIVAYVILAALPVILALVAGEHEDEPFLMQFGLAAGLMGFSLLTLQVALSARFRFIDRAFGHDVVIKFHKAMAVFAGVLLLCHPLSFALQRKSLILFTLVPSWKVHLGQISLILLLGAVLFAVTFKKLGIDYNRWRLLHKGAIFIVVFGFVHGLVIGPDIRPLGMRIYWCVLFALAVCIFLFRNVYMHARGRRRFRVESVEPATHDTWNLVLKPAGGDLFTYRPGQFMFIKILRGAGPVEEHPFTISSSPTQHEAITATIKESGNYTKTLGETKPGDSALIEGPLGRFSFLYHAPQSIVFIAGGVGITPIMSMLSYLRDTGDQRPVTLIYGNKTEADIIFRDELDKLPSHMKVVHVLSAADEAWKGPRGYVNADLIKEHAGDALGTAAVYLCGPPPMMKMLLEAMESLGIDLGRVHFERFEI